MIEKNIFGVTQNGISINSFIIKNAAKAYVEILEFGGIIRSIYVPDKNGSFDDITTGYDNLKEYEENPCYFGAIIGRCANRISESCFELDGIKYKLACNRGDNHLHGGISGFDKKIWTGEIISENKLKLSYTSVDGEEGYPGTLKVEVIYDWSEDCKLTIDYSATSDRATVVNLTNHAYFNLAGHKSPNIYNHLIQVKADHYLPKNLESIPTGEIASVDQTLFDLRREQALGERLLQIKEAVIGLDHAFCFTGESKDALVTLKHPPSGRAMRVFTDQPSVQVYTANYFEGVRGKEGALYERHSSVAVETQGYPDAVHRTHFPTSVLRPGETYRHITSYQFSIID